MSGHNKWSKIKHKKEATDKKKSSVYSKHLAGISAAARENPNLSENIRLKSLIEQAKKANVPNENIERAIKRAAEQKELKPFTLELYGPDNVALIVEAFTDNTNRTSHELRNIANKNGAKVADPGSVLWAFEKNIALNSWAPKFPQTLSVENQKKLDDLIELFAENPDVSNIITSAQ